MRRLPVAYRPEARNDLDDIFRVVLQVSRSVSTARGFVQRIKDRAIASATLRGEVALATIWSPA